MDKAESQSMWIIIGAVLAILIFLVYSFISGGIIRDVAQSMNLITDDSASKWDCMVIPAGDPEWDPDGDGINASKLGCDRYV